MPLRSLSEEVDDTAFADLTINCKGKTFQAHRVLICRKSKVLKAALVGNFVEAKTNELNLDDDEPETVERMLMFCYCDDYDDKLSDAERANLKTKMALEEAEDEDDCDEDDDDDDASEVSHVSSKLVLHASIYAVAEKYDMRTLKSLAKSKFEKIISREYKLFKGFGQVFRAVFGSTPSTDWDLRDIVCHALITFYGEIVTYDQDLKSGLKSVFEGNGMRCYDWLKLAWQEKKSSVAMGSGAGEGEEETVGC